MGLKRTWKKVARWSRRHTPCDVLPLAQFAIRDADAIVTTNEVCDRHGTGVILRRIFGSCPNILSIRSTRLYPEHHLGQEQIRFDHQNISRPESFDRVFRLLNGSTVRRVLCVPFHPDELITGIVLKELFNAPLCVFVMDDNNIHAHGIPDALMREALEKAALRLAISPELRDAYEQKYGLRFWIVPPVVNEQFLAAEPCIPDGPEAQSRTGVLIGSIWSAAWLEKLRHTVRQSGLPLHWYGNAKAPWLKVTAGDLKRDGIIDCGFLPEDELTPRVRKYLYAVVPSGTLDETDDRPEIARLSLPTRMPYLLAAAKTPTIVLGSPKSAAASFLSRFGTGMVSGYTPEALRETVNEICLPDNQILLRENAAAHSHIFSAAGLADWIWKSLELGEACDTRFEEPFSRRDGEVIPFIDPPAPKGVNGDFALLFHCFRRLHRRGYRPDFIIDVGASTGVWSDAAKRVFGKARYLLVDPLHERYAALNDWYFRQNPEFENIAAAVADHPGKAELKVTSDLYGSSLLNPGESRRFEAVKVPVLTLDQIAAEKKLLGRGVLKIDVQCAEHLVLAGARRLLEQVDVLVLELSLFRETPEAKLFPEMCEFVWSLGFHYLEDIGGWRSPIDGMTLQKDVVFVRQSLFVKTSRKATSQTVAPALARDLKPNPQAGEAVAAP